jgi:hypothetical protein
MGHVLVHWDEAIFRNLFADICRIEGHDVIEVSTVEDALMVLRTTLHPLVGILERDHSSLHPDYPLFPTIRAHPELYGQHRYVTVHWWRLSDEDEALLRELSVAHTTGPCTVEWLVAAVNDAIASLPVMARDGTVDPKGGDMA